MNAPGVIAALWRTFEARDWPAMKALYHPDALIITVTGGPAPLRASDAVDELERASADTWYLVKADEPVALDENAVVVVGRMRRSVQPRGFEDASHVWLLTIVDGLIFRQGVYGTTAEAVESYSRLGVSLGFAGIPEQDRMPPNT